MVSLYVSSICLLLGTAIPNQNPQPPVQDAPPTQIEFPQPKPSVQPTVPPPSAKVSVAPNAWFVINSPVKCVVRGYPDGLIDVQYKPGPREISAVFVDGTGKNEDRHYSGPFIYIVTAATRADGSTTAADCTLVMTPVGFKDEKEIKTSYLSVGAPSVDPVTPPVAPQEGIIVMIVETTPEAVVARGTQFTTTPLLEHMQKRKELYRIVDQTAKAQDVARFIEQAKGKTTSQIFILSKDGTQLNSTGGEVCPATPQGIIAILARYGG